ncbi:MurR/RpiR family transcriptional regulator [Virgibacillus xinjiangensis]|uniref:MurR/RpiR family transcriptional regulator n=1 Tax=Virgibacillus xinjiangensis TaxID=393090 RepID=A0ABV7CWR4_9BACI
MDTKENKHCMIRIRSNYASFTHTERRIADYIMEHPQRVINGSINEVADEIGIAVSTVFRFCKTIGFQGFQAMKIVLASELAVPESGREDTISDTDTEASMTEKIFHENMKTLEETLDILDMEAVRQAVECLLGARKVEFFGFGGSNLIAMEAYLKMIRTGIPVYAQSDSHMQVVSASQMTGADVAVLISHSGATRDILDVLDVLKDQRVKTIAITNFSKSPLSERADVVLSTVARESDYRPEAMSSRLAQLSILDALYVNVLVAQKEKGKTALGKVRKAIAGKRI